MSYISKVQINSGSYSKVEPILYGSCDTAASTAIKDVVLIDSSGYELVTGLQIAVKFNTTNTVAVNNLKLRVASSNADDAKPIRYMGSTLPQTNVLADGKLYNFVYDGTYWNLVGDIAIMAATTAEWATRTNYTVPKDTIIVYTDHETYTDNGTTITVPGIKISDGLAYVNSLPFINDALAHTINTHISDGVRHITSAERTFWNNKINCDIDNERLIFNRS